MTGQLCPRLEVSRADYADCSGEYQLQPGLAVAWAPNRPVYTHTDRVGCMKAVVVVLVVSVTAAVLQDRVLFWNAGGLGWSIGKTEYLQDGTHWHTSGSDSAEPWQARAATQPAFHSPGLSLVGVCLRTLYGCGA